MGKLFQDSIVHEVLIFSKIELVGRRKSVWVGKKNVMRTVIVHLCRVRVVNIQQNHHLQVFGLIK